MRGWTRPHWPACCRHNGRISCGPCAHTLQSALQGLQREEEVQASLELMAGVFARLESMCHGAPLNALWKISALVDGMLHGRVANSPALRSLFNGSDKELKRLQNKA